MFLDTSGLLSLYEPEDKFYALATDCFHRAERRITTNYVLAELVALMGARNLSRGPALRFIAGLEQDPMIEVFWVTEGMHAGAMDLLLRRLDKSYSLCDAASFLLMEEQGIVEVLTADHHFEQEGLVCLLR
jgi:uncharacterized protein